MSVAVSEARATDLPQMWQMLAVAASWDSSSPLSSDACAADPHLARYLAGWPLPGDHGLVAVVDGQTVGAAWWRTMTAEEPGYGHIAEDIPEIAVGVEAGHRGAGAGSALLTGLQEAARAMGVAALSLSVQKANPARQLYERLGWREVRDDGDAVTMRWDAGHP